MNFIKNRKLKKWINDEACQESYEVDSFNLANSSPYMSSFSYSSALMW